MLEPKAIAETAAFLSNLAADLTAIGQLLAKLNEILASRSTAGEPLWYLEKKA